MDRAERRSARSFWASLSDRRSFIWHLAQSSFFRGPRAASRVVHIQVSRLFCIDESRPVQASLSDWIGSRPGSTIGRHCSTAILPASAVSYPRTLVLFPTSLIVNPRRRLSLPPHLHPYPSPCTVPTVTVTASFPFAASALQPQATPGVVGTYLGTQGASTAAYMPSFAVPCAVCHPSSLRIALPATTDSGRWSTGHEASTQTVL